MSSFGYGAQTHGHFLHHEGDWAEQNEKPDEAVSELGACGDVGCYAAGIVISNHHDNTGAGDDEKKLERLPYSARPVKQSGKYAHGKGFPGARPLHAEGDSRIRFPLYQNSIFPS